MNRQAAVGVVLMALTAQAVAQAPHSVPQPLPGSDPPEPLFTREVMTRGGERYEIFCTPCHGPGGHGDGIVVRHGFPAPPSFHTGRQSDLTAEQIVEVITSGRGKMLPMAERIPVSDRWAIAAYVKALQLAQRLDAEDLNPTPPGEGR
jgi:mono/diheme cytochrome c family protein